MSLAASSSHADDLARVLVSLVDGSAPDAIVQFLRGGLIAPTAKDDGTCRPLALSNVLRRTSLKALLQLCKDEVSTATGKLQYGILRKSGVEALRKSLQTRLATFPDSVVVSIDFKLAFQRVNRAAACRAMA